MHWLSNVESFWTSHFMFTANNNLKKPPQCVSLVLRKDAFYFNSLFVLVPCCIRNMYQYDLQPSLVIWSTCIQSSRILHSILLPSLPLTMNRNFIVQPQQAKFSSAADTKIRVDMSKTYPFLFLIFPYILKRGMSLYLYYIIKAG